MGRTGRQRRRKRQLKNQTVPPVDSTCMPEKVSTLMGSTCKFVKNSVTKNNGWIRGAKAFESLKGYKNKFKFQNSKKLSNIDTTVRGRNNWIFRLHKPHKGIDSNQINITKIKSGIKDPHTPLPNGSLAVGTSVAKGLRYINKLNTFVLPPLSIAIDTKKVVCSAIADCKQGTTRQTVGTVAKISGGWSGGISGAAGGALVGNLAFPVLGGIVGGIVGGIAGGIMGKKGAYKVVEVIGDKCDYDVITVPCIECMKELRVRSYLGESSENCICSDCIEALERKICDVCGMINDLEVDDPEKNLCESCTYRIEIFIIC